jgi:tryptophanyl-tRNA synthetase
MEEVKDMRWGDFKPILAEAIIDHLAPIQVSQNISSRP